MRYNPKIRSLVIRAITEARIRKWFKRKRKKNPPPSILLSMLLRPKIGMHLYLPREERKKFVKLIEEIYKNKKIILKYRRKYGHRPKLFYKKIFGFSPRKSQSVKIFWSTFNIHFVFKKNDLIAFWKKVQWGPGTGAYYPLGDRDIKIKELRGMISFGREEKYPIETKDVIRHESMHAFEEQIKKRKTPYGKKKFMFYKIKAELNASLHNFKISKKRKRRMINEWARLGLGEEVKETIEDFLSYSETLKRIKNVKSLMRKSKGKRKRLSKKLKKLKERLEQKKKKRRFYWSLYRKTTNQIRKALKEIPIEVLQRIIYETPYKRLHKKIPEAVRVYKRIKYEWYKDS